MTPGKHDRLCARVNNELVLDAGRCEEITGPRGPEKLIRMPPTTLFRQVLAYLESKSDPPVRLSVYDSVQVLGYDELNGRARTARVGSR